MNFIRRSTTLMSELSEKCCFRRPVNFKTSICRFIDKAIDNRVCEKLSVNCICFHSKTKLCRNKTWKIVDLLKYF